MEFFIFILGVIALFFGFKNIEKHRPITSPKTNDPSTFYQAVGTLFTPAERSFLGVLDKAVAGRARVFGKVRILDVVSPKPGLNQSEFKTAFNKISRKHFDFVLCKPDDLSIICAIELDDKSHQRKSRKERDDFVSAVCKHTAVPLIQVPAKAGYSIAGVASLGNPPIFSAAQK